MVMTVFDKTSKETVKQQYNHSQKSDILTTTN